MQICKTRTHFTVLRDSVQVVLAPGELVELSDEEAKLALEQGTVEGEHSDTARPDGSPLSLAEFRAKATEDFEQNVQREYDRYLAGMSQKAAQSRPTPATAPSVAQPPQPAQRPATKPSKPAEDDK